MVGVVLLAVIVLACLVGPLLSPYGVNEQDLAARNQGPSWAHPFGTGALGEDMLTRVLVAGRISLLIGLATALVATVAGAGMGLAAGGRGGWVDSALARLTDLVLIVPGFVILIVLSISFESVGPARDHPDPGAAVLAAALPADPRVGPAHARAALRAGGPRRRAPGAGGSCGATCCPPPLRRSPPSRRSRSGVAILTESALSFLSLGLDPDGRPSWGTLMIGAQDTIEDRPWLTIFPGLMVLRPCSR